MILFRKTIFCFSQLSQIRNLSCRSSWLTVSQFRSSPCQKYFSGSPARFIEDEVPSTLSKYELFSEESAPVILDVEEERQRKSRQRKEEKVVDKFEGLSMKRAIGGVFDIGEIVELIKSGKGVDIFVVKIPPEYNYADYMVIVNGTSTRHMSALCNYIRKLYKMKVGGNGHIPMIEGKNSSIWMAMDLGNIILNVFSTAGREIYNLETLWSLGKDYDTFSKEKTASDYSLTDYSKILASLSPNS